MRYCHWVYGILVFALATAIADDSAFRTTGADPISSNPSYLLEDVPITAPQAIELKPQLPVSAVLGFPGATAGARHPSHDPRALYIYSDYRSPKNHYIPSGWMGDYADLTLDDASTTSPAAGKTCIKITYGAHVSQGFGWAGMYWQDTKDNWGDKSTGLNLTGMKRLTFWARGETGGEVIAEFKVGGISGKIEDTVESRIGPIVLSRDWQQYTIDLSDADLQRVMGGFAWSASFYSNRDGMTFYLDEIRFEH